MKLVVATALTAFAFSAYGGPSTKTSLNGVTPGSTLEQVTKKLQAQYPNCEIESIGFPAEMRTEGVAMVSVSTGPGGGYRDCGATQSSSAQTGYLTVRFVGKEVAVARRAAEISYRQYFSAQQIPTPTIGELLARLRAEYGEPTETRIEQSQAADTPDGRIPNLLSYQLHGVWYAKPSSQGVPCTRRACSHFVLSATLSATAPPDNVATDLVAESVRVDLQDVRLLERERAWLVKRRNARK